MNLFERDVELRVQWQLSDPSERCHDFACFGRPEGVTARRSCAAGSIELLDSEVLKFTKQNMTLTSSTCTDFGAHRLRPLAVLAIAQNLVCSQGAAPAR
jgi:hypothetical protein